MKKSKWYLGMAAFSFLANASLAQAGQEGHGGRVWVCYKPADPITGKREIDTVQLVDYKEANGLLNKWNINLGTDTSNVDNVQEMLNLALQRLSKIDAKRSEAVKLKLQDILNNKSPLGIDLEKDQAQIRKIPDGEYLLEATNEDCAYKQAAFNIVNPKIGEYKYAFVKQFWEQMSDLDKAGLMLHEAIYNLEGDWGATNSDGTRRMVMAISSPQFEELSVAEYLDFMLQNSRNPYSVTIDGISFSNSKVKDGVFSGNIADDHEFHTISSCSYESKCEKRKIFDISVLLKNGELLAFQIDEQNKHLLGVISGGNIYPKNSGIISVKPENVKFTENNHFILSDAEFKNISVPLGGRIEIADLNFNLVAGSGAYSQYGKGYGTIIIKFGEAIAKVRITPANIIYFNYDSAGVITGANFSDLGVSQNYISEQMAWSDGWVRSPRSLKQVRVTDTSGKTFKLQMNTKYIVGSLESRRTRVHQTIAFDAKGNVIGKSKYIDRDKKK